MQRHGYQMPEAIRESGKAHASVTEGAWVFQRERSMANTNQVTGPYSAQVDGKPTGLAGCAAGSCPRAPRCLRADAALAMRQPHNCGTDGRFFIPIATAAHEMVQVA